MIRTAHRCEVCAGCHVPEPCCYGCRCGVTQPPTLDDVLEALQWGRMRVARGQAGEPQALLSLPMAEVLLRHVGEWRDRALPAERARDAARARLAAARVAVEAAWREGYAAGVADGAAYGDPPDPRVVRRCATWEESAAKAALETDR